MLHMYIYIYVYEGIYVYEDIWHLQRVKVAILVVRAVVVVVRLLAGVLDALVIKLLLYAHEGDRLRVVRATPGREEVLQAMMPKAPSMHCGQLNQCCGDQPSSQGLHRESARPSWKQVMANDAPALVVDEPLDFDGRLESIILLLSLFLSLLFCSLLYYYH